jgi:hypothetical protein
MGMFVQFRGISAALSPFLGAAILQQTSLFASGKRGKGERRYPPARVPCLGVGTCCPLVWGVSFRECLWGLRLSAAVVVLLWRLSGVYLGFCFQPRGLLGVCLGLLPETGARTTVAQTRVAEGPELRRHLLWSTPQQGPLGHQGSRHG